MCMGAIRYVIEDSNLDKQNGLHDTITREHFITDRFNFCPLSGR